MNVVTPAALLALAVAVAIVGTPSALGADPRDVVFECPCQAEWAPTGADDSGELTLHFGVRNFRTTESGEVRLSLASDFRSSRSVTGDVSWQELPAAAWLPFGSVGPDTVLPGQTRTFPLARPEPGDRILVLLYERSATVPAGARRADAQHAWQRHEALTLWPVPADASSGRMHFVDLLTDSDGDGVGDVNERIADTSHENPGQTPGRSSIDVLALFDGQVHAAYGGDPYTRIHHLMALTRARFADSGTNIQLRTVGIRHTRWNSRGLSYEADALMAAHGADMVVQFHARPGWPCRSSVDGCAPIGSAANRGLWTPVWAAVVASTGADTVAHQLGHALGLDHSAREGEAAGAFRWSRGYYVRGAAGRIRPQGTIMTHGQHGEFGDRFSSSRTFCHGERCGVGVDAPDGADAVASLDLLRFQAAALREAIPDTDGDGFVDAVDAFPNDRNGWSDLDEDGYAESVDLDDDGDGVDDQEDAFPFDPAEWADMDGDGVGDNLDSIVADLTPFRDPYLRTAVEQALNKPPDTPITDSELATIENLSARNRSIRNLTGLELATGLVSLDLRLNAISDLSPLSALTSLETLRLDGNDIHDLSPLAGLAALETLGLGQNTLSDVAPLAELTSLTSLALDHNQIRSVSPLANLTALTTLNLSANAVADLSPLAGLAQLTHLEASDNAITDVSPLSALRLEVLRIGHNNLAPENLRNLQLRENATLDLTGLRLDHLYGLPNLANVRELILRDNLISEVSRLTELTGIKLLDLSANDIADIGPLLRRYIWRDPHPTSDARLRLDGNPLGRRALDADVPTLRSWGLEVQLDDRPDRRRVVTITDPTLQGLIAQSLAGGVRRIDHAISDGTIPRLRTLRATGAGLSDLAGLDAARNLEYLFAASNNLTDLTPLADLRDLRGLDLSGNDIVDIGPLRRNQELRQGDWIVLDDNPLNEESVNVHIPALLERGVAVSFAGVRLGIASPDAVEFEVGGYFAAVLGNDARIRTKVRDPALAHAKVSDGRLTVRGGASGVRATVTVTGTDEDGGSATLTFFPTLPRTVFAGMFPSAADPVREGFVRFINDTFAPQSLRIAAFEKTGAQREPATLEVGAGRSAQFNSGDLETGNQDKGLSGGVGPGNGDWRLALQGTRDVQVLSYIRTTDGFVTSMHELAPMTDTGYRVVFFNPGSNLDQVSLLRLANPRSEAAEVTITGIDDTGASPGGPVTLSLAPQASLTLSAQELEAGEGLTGALGDGTGKWRLHVTADHPILVASLLRSPTGHLANLSSVPDNQIARGTETVHGIPLFLSASEAGTRQGFARVINRGSEEATIHIRAWDDAGTQGDPISLAVAAGAVAHFNSTDLEFGNATKGLSGGVGHGDGHWRLELVSEADLDVLAYIRTADGFVTSMHDTVPLTSGRHEAPIFNPGSNRAQVSMLRIVNPDTDQAWVSITGVDNAGERSGNVAVAVPPGQALTLSAETLESGEGVGGGLGDGAGKWRLTVTPRKADQRLQVMSLLQSPTGHLTNLSTGRD